MRSLFFAEKFIASITADMAIGDSYPNSATPDFQLAFA